MIETKVTQTCRFACDRCGSAPAEWSGCIAEAAIAAAEAAFTVSRWQQDGCARELWLCGPCKLEALQDMVVTDRKVNFREFL